MYFIVKGCHNPYFNRWFSAIKLLQTLNYPILRHNPYFNRWFSAIGFQIEYKDGKAGVTILILIDGFLQ